MPDAVAAPPAPTGAPAQPAGKQAVRPVKKGPVVEHKGAPPAGGASPNAAGGKDDRGGHSFDTKDAAPKPPAPAAPEKPKPVRVRMKIGGNEEVEEFESQEHMEREFQRRTAEARALQRRESQISARAKAIEEAAAAADTDPFSVIKAINPTWTDEKIRDYMHAQLKKEYDAEQMSPEQKAIAERDAELAKYRKAEEDRKAEEAKAAHEKLQEAERQRYERMMLEAIKETAEEGDDDDYQSGVLLRDVASIYLQSRQYIRSLKEADPDLDTTALELTPREISMKVRQMHARTFDRQLAKAPDTRIVPAAIKRLAALPDDRLLSSLGPDVVARIVKAHVAATDPFKAPPPVIPSSAPATDAAPAWQSRPPGALGPQGESAIPERKTIPRF